MTTSTRRARKARRRGRLPFPVFLLAVCAAVTIGVTSVRALTAAPGSGGGEAAMAGTAERLMAFLDYFAGVFTLLALTAAVVCGLAATDRLVLRPRHRVAAQSVHRAASVAAVGFLGTHIGVKVAERHATPLATLLPFGGGATFAVGLGTLAADLLVLVAATGAVRGRFAESRRPWLWRTLHASAYVSWPLALAHGLTAGRAAATWVLWSYGVCAALIGLALLVRALGMLDRGGSGARARRTLQAHSPARPSRTDLAGLAALSREHEPTPYAVPAASAEADAEDPAPWHEPVAPREPLQPVGHPAEAAAHSHATALGPWPMRRGAEAREHPPVPETPPHGVPLIPSPQPQWVPQQWTQQQWAPQQAVPPGWAQPSWAQPEWQQTGWPQAEPPQAGWAQATWPPSEWPSDWAQSAWAQAAWAQAVDAGAGQGAPGTEWSAGVGAGGGGGGW